MSKVAIVTDSTASIPKELLNGLSISHAPLQVIWGEKIYLDNVDITAQDFYQRLEHTDVMPSTSQATPNGFTEVYSKLVAEGYDILSIHISSKLSATLDSATMAAREFPNARIELVDSRLTSMAMGFPVLEAARAAREGATLEECKRIVELCLPLCGVMFIPKTLEFLHRGGRIGGAAAFLGSALDLKPILHLVDGKIEPAQRVRTMGKAIDRMLDMFAERIGKNTPIHVAALHANALDQAGVILEKVRQRYDVADIKDAVFSEVSPVLGTHTGPGTVGIGYMAGK